jgi:hypothetical protein
MTLGPRLARVAPPHAFRIGSPDDKRPAQGQTGAQFTERGGFEPPMDGSPIPVFETGAFNRSATSPVSGQPTEYPAG